MKFVLEHHNDVTLRHSRIITRAAFVKTFNVIYLGSFLEYTPNIKKSKFV